MLRKINLTCEYASGRCGQTLFSSPSLDRTLSHYLRKVACRYLLERTRHRLLLLQEEMLAAHQMQAPNTAASCPDLDATRHLFLISNLQCLQSQCKGHRDTSRTRPAPHPRHACHEKNATGPRCAVSRQQCARSHELGTCQHGTSVPFGLHIVAMERDLHIVPIDSETTSFPT